MKKYIILLLTLSLMSVPVYAKTAIESGQNAVYLDLENENGESADLHKGRVNMEAIDIKYAADPRKKQKDVLLYEDVNRMRPEKKTVSKGIEKEVIKDTSVGATYSTTEKSGEMKDSVSVYSKYQKEHFGVTTAYSQDRDTYRAEGAGAGTVSVAPEVALNKHVKLKNVYSENMSNNQQKNELVLSITPFKDDRMDLDLGAGQTFSTTNQPAKSQINIGTKFRF